MTGNVVQCNAVPLSLYRRLFSFICHLQGCWDQHWLSCPNLDTVQNQSAYEQSINKQMALHTRYPGHGNHIGPEDSQLQRTLQLIDNVFDQCQTRHCIPQHTVALLDWMMYDNSRVHRHRASQHLSGVD